MLGSLQVRCLHGWQAKIEKEAHKEEMRHTHDKGVENLSNAAARPPRPPLYWRWTLFTVSAALAALALKPVDHVSCLGVISGGPFL